VPTTLRNDGLTMRRGIVGRQGPSWRPSETTLPPTTAERADVLMRAAATIPSGGNRGPPPAAGQAARDSVTGLLQFGPGADQSGGVGHLRSGGGVEALDERAQVVELGGDLQAGGLHVTARVLGEGPDLVGLVVVSRR